MAAQSGSDLCRQCGLCCGGTLFGYVAVTDEEARRLRHRLPILPATEKLEQRFEIPCAALGPRGCDVYVDRPKPCSDFKCKLLRRLEAGGVSLQSALDTVAQIIGVVGRLDLALPAGSSFHARRALLPEVGERVPRDVPPEIWLDLKVLDILARRELHDPADPRVEDVEDVAGDPAPAE